MQETIGDRIRAARMTLKLSQREAVGKFEIPLGSIRKYETGPSVPGASALAGLARAGVSVDWLLTGEGAMLRQIAPTEDAQTEEAQWQIAKLALAAVPHSHLVSQEQSAELDAFVFAYNVGGLGVSAVLFGAISSVTADLIRAWCREAMRWRHRWDTAPASVYQPQPAQAVPKAAEPTLKDQPVPIHLNELELARIVGTMRKVIATAGVDIPAAAAAAAELYADVDPGVNRRLLEGVMRGIWRAQKEEGALVMAPDREANAIAQICNQLSQIEDRPEGLTGTAA